MRHRYLSASGKCFGRMFYLWKRIRKIFFFFVFASFCCNNYISFRFGINCSELIKWETYIM